MKLKTLTLEQALKEGKEIIFPTRDNEFPYETLMDRISYRRIVKQMYNKGIVIGIKKDGNEDSL